MDGCFSVYVLNTTEALFLFFKQRNLEGGGSGGEGRTEIEKEGRMKTKGDGGEESMTESVTQKMKEERERDGRQRDRSKMLFKETADGR